MTKTIMYMVSLKRDDDFYFPGSIFISLIQVSFAFIFLRSKWSRWRW